MWNLSAGQGRDSPNNLRDDLLFHLFDHVGSTVEVGGHENGRRFLTGIVCASRACRSPAFSRRIRSCSSKGVPPLCDKITRPIPFVFPGSKFSLVLPPPAGRGHTKELRPIQTIRASGSALRYERGGPRVSKNPRRFKNRRGFFNRSAHRPPGSWPGGPSGPGRCPAAWRGPGGWRRGGTGRSSTPRTSGPTGRAPG